MLLKKIMLTMATFIWPKILKKNINTVNYYYNLKTSIYSCHDNTELQPSKKKKKKEKKIKQKLLEYLVAAPWTHSVPHSLISNWVTLKG